MKLFRKLRVFVLLFTLLPLVLGFVVLSAPKTEASRPCDCYCMICMLIPPYWCWDTCCQCPPIGPPEGP